MPLLDLEKIALSGQCFRWERLGRDHFRIPHAGECLEISMTEAERFSLSCGEEQFETLWRDYFDLKENYRSIRKRIDPEQDPFLWKAAEQEQGIRILWQDPWEMLITFIISQNKNIPAIRSCVNMLAARCGERKTDSRGQEYYGFPEPAAIAVLSEKDMLECRLGYRCKYVLAAAKAVAGGEIKLEQLLAADERTTIAALTGLYGVGTKVANCVSLFGLHHIDAFPVDVWIRRILTEQYPDGYPYDRYAPYNGIYQQYMFACYRHRSIE